MSNKVCDKCGGYGEVSWGQSAPPPLKGGQTVTWVECPKCKGKRVIEDGN